MVRNINAQPVSIKRKTQYDLVLAGFDDIWVCVDTRYPNRLFEQAATEGALGEFSEYISVHREVALDQVSNCLTAAVWHTKLAERHRRRNMARESEGQSGVKQAQARVMTARPKMTI